MRRLFVVFLTVLAAFTTRSAHGQPPAKWQLQPIATIEGVSDDEPFGVLRGIALHRDGRVVVVDRSTHRVSMFDASGKSLGFVGRIGGGPGEFRDPYSAAWIADTLAIYDPGESRIAFLANGKTPLRTESTVRLTGGPDIRLYPVSANKTYLSQIHRIGTRVDRTLVSISGVQRDTIVLPPPPQLPTGTMCNIANGGIRFFNWFEAPAAIMLPVRADGSLVLGNTGSYELKVQNRAGTTVASLKRTDMTFLPLQDFAWEHELEPYRKHVAEYGASSCQSTPVRPPHRAPIKAVTVADNGDIWVSAYGTGDYAHDVFAPDGKYRATIPIKGIVSNHIPLAIAGDRVALVEQDRDGVQVVKVFRIVR